MLLKFLLLDKQIKYCAVNLSGILVICMGCEFVSNRLLLVLANELGYLFGHLYNIPMHFDD